jgi:hypothetical protein
VLQPVGCSAGLFDDVVDTPNSTEEMCAVAVPAIQQEQLAIATNHQRPPANTGVNHGEQTLGTVQNSDPSPSVTIQENELVLNTTQEKGVARTNPLSVTGEPDKLPAEYVKSYSQSPARQARQMPKISAETASAWG